MGKVQKLRTALSLFVFMNPALMLRTKTHQLIHHIAG